MDIDKRDLAKFCERIITGRSLFYHPSGFYLQVYDPVAIDRQEANILSQSYEESLALEGIPSIEFMELVAEEKGIWRADYDAFLKDYPSKKKELLADIRRLEFRSIERLKPEAALRRLESQYKQINDIKFLLEQNSIEYLTALYKNRYFVFKCTLDAQGNKYYDMSFDDFLKSADGHIIDKIIGECFYPKHITEKVIRLVARNEPWRSMWIAALKAGNLFNRPTCDYTDWQRALVSWSVIYDNAFESMEPPDEDTVEDDALFDAWLHNKHEDNQRKRSTRSSLGAGTTSKDKAEVGVLVNTPEDAQKVWKMNNPHAVAQIKRNQQVINEKGIVKEAYLPDSQQLMRNKLAQSRT